MNILRHHPWLLVVAAFLLLISAWITVIWVSGKIPNRRLTPAEEARVLQIREAGR